MSRDTAMNELIESMAHFDQLTYNDLFAGDASPHTISRYVMRLHKFLDTAKTMANGVEPPLLKTYYIYKINEDGDDLTKFVRATSPGSAAQFWQDHVNDSGVHIDATEVSVQS